MVMVKVVGAMCAYTIDEWRSIVDYLIFKGYKWNPDFEGSSKYNDEYFEEGERYIEIWEDKTLTKTDMTGAENVFSLQKLLVDIFFYKLIATSGIKSGRIILESDDLYQMEQFANNKVRVQWSIINYKGDLISHSL